MMRPSAGLAAMFAIAGLASAAAAPQQPLVFSSRVQAVLVDALVTQNGRPVSGLTAADFEVRDNGVLQKIDLLDAANLPINAVLALDTSASTAGRASLSEICQIVSQTDAPFIRAASSISALDMRKVADISRKTSGDHRKPSISTMPQSE